jgi:hypothetical protein
LLQIKDNRKVGSGGNDVGAMYAECDPAMDESEKNIVYINLVN